jgi:hydroxymethylpyrimidine pyrophosphatase-like HAD family hydrolase
LPGADQGPSSFKHRSGVQQLTAGLEDIQRGKRTIHGSASGLPKYRVVASDMDGTFLARDHSIPERNVQAAMECIRRGIFFLPATGKSRAGAMASIGPLATLLTSNYSHGAPGVYIQGLVVYGLHGELVYQQTLPRETAWELVRVQRELHFGTLVAYSGDRIVCERRNVYTERLVPYHEPEPDDSLGSSWERLLELSEREFPINKMLFVDSVERIRELRPFVEAAIGEKKPTVPSSNGEFGTAQSVRPGASHASVSSQADARSSLSFPGQHGVLHTHQQGRCVQACPDMLEVLPVNANKGDGLRRLLEHIGIPSEQVLAIGDAENDLEMIRNAGLGVAVGNALPMLKEAADVVLEETNDEAAVAAAVERFILIPLAK